MQYYFTFTRLILLFAVFMAISCNGEDIVETNNISKQYVSYFTGNSTDAKSSPSGGVCLMGGAAENDEAMKWFLRQANGGDIVVLRASGSNGYNNYLYKELNVEVNSVETIVFKNGSASFDENVLNSINKSEAIWIAGGDQWDYVSFWRNTPIVTSINDSIANRGIVIGGTSAGMAILGSFYFTAENGTVTSSEALGDPFDNKISIGTQSFIKTNHLENTITDTHYDNPDRRGRHTTFLARIITDHNIAGKGIACDEYTAVCIDNKGIARVFGGFPDFDDNAYFVTINDEVKDNHPENCSPGNPLDWNQSKKALKVYQIKGNNVGSNTFDLNNWKNGKGGWWKFWYVEKGFLKEGPKI